MLELVVWFIKMGFYVWISWQLWPFIRTVFTDVSLWQQEQRAKESAALEEKSR